MRGAEAGCRGVSDGRTDCEGGRLRCGAGWATFGAWIGTWTGAWVARQDVRAGAGSVVGARARVRRGGAAWGGVRRGVAAYGGVRRGGGWPWWERCWVPWR